MINSFEDLRERQFVRVEGEAHWSWLPWSELRDEATPKFRRMWDRKLERARVHVNLGADYTRRAVAVSTRKYRARRKRR